MQSTEAQWLTAPLQISATQVQPDAQGKGPARMGFDTRRGLQDHVLSVQMRAGAGAHGVGHTMVSEL